MKKLILLFLLLIPLKVSASEVTISDFLIDAYILENGDLEVNELIVADGTFNWFERDLLYKNSKLTESNYANNKIYNATDITNFSVKGGHINNVSFATFNDLLLDFDLVLSASNGALGKYTISNLTDGYRYRMYYHTTNSKTAFYLKYTVKDVAVLHNDIAEVYWTFIPNDFEVDIKNVEIKLHLPQEDNTSNLRFWAHGNLTGEVTKLDNSSIYATINNLEYKDQVDLRVTFTKDLLNQDLVFKKSNDNALDNIIEVETTRANEANALRAKLLKQYNFVKNMTHIFIITIIILGIYFYLKYGKSPKPDYFSKYNREFIDDYNVEIVDYLMNRKITPNAMSASILNLIYKKNIKVEEITPQIKTKTKEYQFTLDNTNYINETEQLLIDFLFNKVSQKTNNDQKIFTTMDLKKYAASSKTCTTFINTYTKWQNKVLEDGKAQEFYLTNSTPKIGGIIIFILGMLLIIYSANIGVDYYLTYLLPIFSMIFLVFCLTLIKKTPKGAEHYARWQAFKNFLNDFGTFDIKELPEIVLWERYLVYATVFGLAKKVQKSMNVKITEYVNEYGELYYPYYFYLDLTDNITHGINRALSSAYNKQSANYANSHSSYSSGGGFGGGFSSGGGFGGGGGGGRFG